jgi:hypothetical protein
MEAADKAQAVVEPQVIILRDMTPKERDAFLSWFYGGQSFVIKYGNRDHVFFGKHECERVPFDFWLNTLPSLGWIEIKEVRRFIAIGAISQPEAVEYQITPTDKGFDVREAWRKGNRG